MDFSIQHKIVFFLHSNFQFSRYIVCKALSVIPSFTIGGTAFLQLIVEYCVTETSKPKAVQANMETLEIALKIVTNCCLSVEARQLIARVRKKQN